MLPESIAKGKGLEKYGLQFRENGAVLINLVILPVAVHSVGEKSCSLQSGEFTLHGDGITAISKDIEIIKNRKAETILTPHMGEMSRITKMEISEVNKNKIGVLQRTAKELNVIVVLKGAHSLMGYPDETVFINMSGNPGMATAGSGDVLTGTIAAMFGLGLPLKDAV
ncbi:unnamed protein product, partial [marine sediment metagenome]